MEDSRLDVGNGFCSIPNLRWQGYLRTPFAALLIGAALGFVLGFLFARNQKAKSHTK